MFRPKPGVDIIIVDRITECFMASPEALSMEKVSRVLELRVHG